MINSVNSLSLSLLFLIEGLNSKIISLFSDKDIFILRLFLFSFIIIWLLYILSFNSSNISSKASYLKKYSLSFISSNEYLLEYDLWIISLIWSAVISIELSKANLTSYELFLSVLSYISIVFSEFISASSDIYFF